MARKKETKRSDGYYEVKCVVGHAYDGKAIYKSFYSRKSKADARAKAEKYKLEAGKEKSLKKFSEVAEELREIKKEQVRGNTYYSTWVSMIDILIEYFGDYYIEAMTKDDITQYFKKRKDLKTVTLSHYVAVLRNIFSYAKDNEYIEHDIMSKYKLEYGKKSEDKKVFTPEQTLMCLEYCKTHKYGLAVHLMLSYGLSRSEMLGITAEAVNEKDKTIDICRTVVFDGKNNSINKTKNRYRNRIIAITDETIDMIRATGITSGFIFSNDKGKNPVTPNTISNRTDMFMKDMSEHYAEQGIDIPRLHCHELRHTRATLWVNEGRNLFAIALQMGWGDLDMLRKRYAHADIHSLRKELDI